jgi:hypothetical protein
MHAGARSERRKFPTAFHRKTVGRKGDDGGTRGSGSFRRFRAEGPSEGGAGGQAASGALEHPCNETGARTTSLNMFLGHDPSLDISQVRAVQRFSFEKFFEDQPIGQEMKTEVSGTPCP